MGTTKTPDTAFQSNTIVGKEIIPTPVSTIVHGWHQNGFVFHTFFSSSSSFCDTNNMSSKVDRRLRSSSISSSFDAILSLKNRSFSATIFASSFTSSSSFDDDAFTEKRRRAVVRRRVVAIDDSCRVVGRRRERATFIIVVAIGALKKCGTNAPTKNVSIDYRSTNTKRYCYY